MNLDKIETSPRLKFRLTYKERSAIQHIVEIDELENYALGDADIDQFTGFRDKDGREIYGGDVVERKGDFYVIFWNADGLWYAENLTEDDDTALWAIARYRGCKILGNIHNLGALPEVKKMLAHKEET